MVRADGLDRGPRPLPAGLVLWLLGVAAWLALAPFRWRLTPVDFQWRPSADEEMLGHLLLLVPLAAVIGARAATGWGALLRAFGAAAVAGVVLEASQSFVDARALSPWDLLEGLVGALVALACTRLALRNRVRPGTVMRVVFGVVLAGTCLGVGISARTHNKGHVIEDWNALFAVVEGDEYEADRPYVGEVTGARVCAGSREARECARPGADATTRERVAREAERSQVVSLSAEIVSGDPAQSGPARIVSFSWGPYGRNATLAQLDDQLLFRLRTRRGGPNGVWHQLTLLRAVTTGVPTRVEALFDHGRFEVSAATATATVRGSYAAPFGGTLLSRGTRSPHMPYVLRGRGLAVAAVLGFAGLGLAVGAFASGRPRVLLPGAAVAAVALLWLQATVWWSSPRPGLAENLTAAAAMLAGTLLGLWDRRRGAFGPSSA